MTEPTGAASAAAPPAGRGSWLVLAAGVALGLGLRVAWAYHRGDSVAEWEADGFVRSWEALGFPPLSPTRPPLAGWVQQHLAQGLQVQSILGVRLLSVGLSLLPLAGALVLAHTVTRALGGRAGASHAAARWTVGGWAVLPALVASAASPTADALLGALLCLTLASAVQLVTRPGAVATVLLALAALGAVLTGGVIVACALIAGLLIYLLPVPPVRTALPAALAVGLACAGALWLQRTPAPAATWLPDTAPAYGLAALVDVPMWADSGEPVDPGRRVAVTYEAAFRGAQQAGAWPVASAFGQRLTGDLLAPDRFGADARMARAAGLFDLWLAACLLLWALTALAGARARGTSTLPRAGVTVAVLVLGAGLVVSATHPFALAPCDALLPGLAGAAIACTQPARRAVRWGVCAAGGVVLAAVGAGAAAHAAPRPPWITTLNHEQDQGRLLVDALADGGPREGRGELFVAQLLADRATPFLRLPEAALRHAVEAVHAAPLDEGHVGTLVMAELENLDFQRAQELASSMRDATGHLSARGRVLLHWVEESERRWRFDRQR